MTYVTAGRKRGVKEIFDILFEFYIPVEEFGTYAWHVLDHWSAWTRIGLLQT
jgi:hypothetical protein